MAPMKEAGKTKAKAKASPMPATRSSGRLTRSSAKRLNTRLAELPTEPIKKRKVGKAAETKKKEKKGKPEVEAASAANKEAPGEVNLAEEEGGGEADVEDDKNEDKEEDAKEESVHKKTIEIEHCKQCNAFKTRAIQVQDALQSAFPSITVLLNPNKPRRGCFEIREKDGEKFISLLEMKRPFPPLKALDMNKVISDIINRVKSSTKASQ